LDETDFYLVDPRGARIDIIWLEHLRRCGAILQDRSSPEAVPPAAASVAALVAQRTLRFVKSG
jgi:hypothetical protein